MSICQPCEGTGVVWSTDVAGNEVHFVCPKCAGFGSEREAQEREQALRNLEAEPLICHRCKSRRALDAYKICWECFGRKELEGSTP